MKELELIEKFSDLNLAMAVKPKSLKFGMLKTTSDLLQQIQATQSKGEFLYEKNELMKQGKELDFQKKADGLLKIQKSKLCLK